jgi:uncharacterized protein
LSLYLDASVQLPMIVAELDGSVVDSFLRTTADALAVSHFAAAEVASALSRLVRMHRLHGHGCHRKIGGLR